MTTFLYSPSDQALAQRIQADLAAQPTSADVVIVSSQSARDPEVLAKLDQALDQNREIIPVLAENVPLPKLIEHLTPVDFSTSYAIDELKSRLQTASEFHMKVLTPSTAVSNRRAGIVVGVIAVVMFAAGLYLVGVVGVQAPQEEFDYVETEIILTRDYYVDEALPRSTEDAANFQATVDAARPTLRPVLIATATAAAASEGE